MSRGGDAPNISPTVRRKAHVSEALSRVPANPRSGVGPGRGHRRDGGGIRRVLARAGAHVVVADIDRERADSTVATGGRRGCRSGAGSSFLGDAPVTRG